MYTAFLLVLPIPTSHVGEAACALIPPTAAAQDEAGTSETTYDLAHLITVGEPVAIELERKGSFVATEGPGLPDLEFEDEWTLVDVFEVLEDDRWSAERYYARAFSKHDGAVVDKELNGLLARCSGGSEGTSSEILGERWALQKTLDEVLLPQAESVGLWIPLPREARVGDEFELDVSSVQGLLFDLDAEVESVAAVTPVRLDSVVEDRATLLGTWSFELEGEMDGHAIAQTLELSARIEVDLAAHRITELRLEGEARWRIRFDRMDVVYEGDVSYAARTLVGSKAKALRRKKPVFRPVRREIENVEASFELPSDWVQVSGDGQPTSLQTVLGAGAARSFINVDPVTLAGADIAALSKSVPGELEAKGGERVKRKSASSPLGKVVGFTYEAEGAFYYLEFLPLGGSKFVRVRLGGVTDRERDAYMRVYQKARKSWRKA